MRIDREWLKEMWVGPCMNDQLCDWWLSGFESVAKTLGHETLLAWQREWVRENSWCTLTASSVAALGHDLALLRLAEENPTLVERLRKPSERTGAWAEAKTAAFLRRVFTDCSIAWYDERLTKGSMTVPDFAVTTAVGDLFDVEVTIRDRSSLVDRNDIVMTRLHAAAPGWSFRLHGMIRECHLPGILEEIKLRCESTVVLQTVRGIACRSDDGGQMSCIQYDEPSVKTKLNDKLTQHENAGHATILFLQLTNTASVLSDWQQLGLAHLSMESRKPFCGYYILCDWRSNVSSPPINTEELSIAGGSVKGAPHAVAERVHQALEAHRHPYVAPIQA